MLSLFSLPMLALSRGMLFILNVKKAGGVSGVLEYDPGWLALAGGETLYSVLLGAFALYVLPGFFMKKRATPVRMQIIFVALLLENVALIIVNAVQTGKPESPNYLQFILPIAWFSYFGASKRVKETFIR